MLASPDCPGATPTLKLLRFQLILRSQSCLCVSFSAVAKEQRCGETLSLDHESKDEIDVNSSNLPVAEDVPMPQTTQSMLVACAFSPHFLDYSVKYSSR